MKLSILIPVFNEERTLPIVIKKVKSEKLSGISKDIIIVDDGSTDRTPDLIRKIVKNQKAIKALFHSKNKGKGAAIRTGLKAAKGDYILIQDADLEYDPTDIPILIKPIIEGKATVVYGTRLKRMPNFKKDERTIQFFFHYLGNKVLSFITGVLYGQMLTDMETGYKLFPREALRGMRLSAYSFDFEPEITAKLIKKGYLIHEVPIKTNPRGYNEGKKLKPFQDGAIALYSLLKYRFKN